MCEHYCSECTAVKKKKKNKISSLLRRQNQVINLSSRVWWLPWGWSFRQALKRASLCLLVCRAHWWLKTVRGTFCCQATDNCGKKCCLLCFPTAKMSLCPWPGGEGRLHFHFPCSHRQHQLITQALDFPLNELQSFNFWFFRNCLNKWLVLILAKSLLYSV